MNITCIICSELFINESDVFFTQCGHIFHFQCLINWLERSKSCPQCRNRVTEKTIHKVYFNFSNNDQPVDATTLMHKLDTVNFTLTLKDKEIKNLREKKNKLKDQNRGLREEVSRLESTLRNTESTMHAFKDQIMYFKTKAKESDRLSEEIVKLKNRIKNMENVEVAIHGSRDQVNSILRDEHSTESLAMLAAMLKKALLDCEKKARDSDFNLKRVKNEFSKYKKEYSSLEAQNADLRRELQQIKLKNEKERQILKVRIKNAAKNNIVVANPDAGTLNTSTADVLVTDDSHTEQDFTLNTSLTVAERINDIVNSDSPYLPVKTHFGAFLDTKFEAPAKSSSTSLNKGPYTIFKSSQKLADVKKGTNSEVSYDGLGGSSKEDCFPSPKPQSSQTMKRHKSSTSISSSKFRRLAPTSGAKTKITSFINISD